MNERPIPPAAVQDENSVEMLRVWIAQQKLHCSLKVGMYRDMNMDEMAAWGTILADAARHISMSASSAFGEDQNDSLSRIRERFNSELAAPTSDVEGEFVKR
jgi:hypothetical protein